MRQYRVSCGGRWLIGLSAYLVVRARHRSTSSFRYNVTGFRCALTERARLSRVNRGGSWYIVVAAPLAARARLRYAPSSRGSNLGFRCARNR